MGWHPSGRTVDTFILLLRFGNEALNKPSFYSSLLCSVPSDLVAVRWSAAYPLHLVDDVKSVSIQLSICLLPLVLSLGCSGDPPLQPVSGKVTIDGQSYERLIIYMDPVDGPVTAFNKGVGETDVKGDYTMNSTASTAEEMGLAAGEYRVYFNCWMRKGQATGLANEKPDENSRTLETEDIVPPPYNSPQDTPLRFTVEGGQENKFDFDIKSKG